MKALVKFAKGREGLEIRDIPKPEPKGNELLIKIMAAGICGTDIHIMNDEFFYIPPVVIGHEYTGVVESMGPEATHFKPGDQVVSLTTPYTCGECRYCRQSLLMLCEKRRSIGYMENGTMAEYMVIPEHLAFKVPENMKGDDVIAIAEPAACATRSVLEQSLLRAGDVAVVSGPGTIGLIVVMLAKIQGAFVILSGLAADAERLKLGKELGADVVVSNPEELNDIVRSHAPDGADVAFECSGVLPSFNTCVNVLRKQGNLAQMGLFGKEIPIFMDDILFKELNLTVNFAQERTSWELLLKLIGQGYMKGLSRLVSDRIPLEKWETGFDKFMNKEGYKIFLTP